MVLVKIRQGVYFILAISWPKLGGGFLQQHLNILICQKWGETPYQFWPPILAPSNVIICQKWSKTFYQSLSFWKTSRITLVSQTIFHLVEPISFEAETLMDFIVWLPGTEKSCKKKRSSPIMVWPSNRWRWGRLQCVGYWIWILKFCMGSNDFAWIASSRFFLVWHVKSNATTFTVSVNRMRGKYDPNLSFTVPPST